MSIKGSLLKNSAWSVSSVLVNQLFGFIVLAVLARYIVPTQYGIVAFAVVFIEFTRTIMLAGLPDALVRQKQWDEEFASTVFWANMAMATALSLATALAGLIIIFAGSTTLGYVFLALAPGFLLDAVAASPDAKLRHDFKFSTISVRDVSANFLGGIIAIVAVVSGLGLWAIVIRRMATAVLSVALLWSVTDWRPRFTFSFPLLKPVIAYSWHLMTANLLGQLNFRGVEFILGAFAGPTALALYQIAGRGLNMILAATILPLQRVALTAFSKLPDERAVGSAYLRITNMTALITFPVFIGAAVISEEFVALSFGPAWQAAGAIMALQALLVGPHTLNYFSTPAISAVGKSRLIARYNMFMIVTTIATTAAAAPFGVFWVALANSIRAHLILPVALQNLKRGVGVPPIQALMGLAAPAAAAAIMAAAMLLARRYLLADLSPLARLAIMVPAGGILYGLAICGLAPDRVRAAFSTVSPGLQRIRRRVGIA